MDLGPFFGSRYVQISMGFFATIFAIIAAYFMLQEDKPEPDIWCAFKGRSGQPPVFMGRVQGPIERVRLAGKLIESPENDKFTFDGEAWIETKRQSKLSQARGDIFVNSSERVQGMSLTLTGEDLGPDDVRIVTLNRSGGYRDNSSQAYIYGNPRFRLTHPMFYACRATLPAPEAESAETNGLAQ